MEFNKHRHRFAIQEEDHIKTYVKQSIPKSAEVRNLIYEAIQSNVLFENCSRQELEEILDIFQPVRCAKGDAVITQGENGKSFYVVEKGDLSINVAVMDENEASGNKNDVVNMVVGYLSEGKAFGELALIYQSPRAATIRAETDCMLWKVERSWYRGLLGQIRKRLHEEKRRFSGKVIVNSKGLKNLKGKKFEDIFRKVELDKIADLAKTITYDEGEVIIREGEEGDNFYMIQSVRSTMSSMFQLVICYSQSIDLTIELLCPGKSGYLLQGCG